jgi:hypothetical protein
MDVFAADLWEVYKNQGPDEYKDAARFFEKTYVTDGLNNLLEIIENRLKGKGGDPVIQIQTPFGGGKTHALIAMYHKAIEWKVKPVVIVGTSMNVKNTPWGQLEKQLTGKIDKFADKGWTQSKEEIKKLLQSNQQYVTKAAGVKVEVSTLSSQVMAFMQELSTAVASVENAALIITLPASIMEHYDEQAEKLFNQLQKVSGRVEKIYTPVQEHEISSVIRQRLFSDINIKKAQSTIKEFVDYAAKENILPAGTEPSEYRSRFEASYPFLPEVINVLYHRWGSFPNFQRTRGVLRLLSLVIHALKDSSLPHISIADFDMKSQEIRRELLKHIGQEFDSIVAADITGDESGSKKTDLILGDAYKGLKLASRAATTIFLYSFSGGHDKGATLSEVKLHATTIQNPSSVVVEAIEGLKGNLFYLQQEAGKNFFSNQPNLNRILVTKVENIEQREIAEVEEEILKKSIAGHKLKVFLYPKQSADVADGLDLKLIVLDSKDDAYMKDILEKKGLTPRIFRNALFILAPMDVEQSGFQNYVKRHIAYKEIADDKTINLSDEQKKQVKSEIKKSEAGLSEAVRRYYRQVFVPIKDGFKEIDLGIPTFGESKKIDDEVYDKLRIEGDVLERIYPLLIKERYLGKNDYIPTEQLYQSCAKTPGEFRVIDTQVWARGISEGIQQGLFGLGEVEAEKPVCRFFKDSNVSVALSGDEVIIREDLCSKTEKGGTYSPADETLVEPKQTEEESEGFIEGGTPAEIMDSLGIEFTLPKGKVSDIARVMNLIQSKFNILELTIKATDGRITKQAYKEKILEAFKQMGIDID